MYTIFEDSVSQNVGLLPDFLGNRKLDFLIKIAIVVLIAILSRNESKITYGSKKIEHNIDTPLNKFAKKGIFVLKKKPFKRGMTFLVFHNANPSTPSINNLR